MSSEAYSIEFKLVKHLVIFPAYLNGEGPFDFWLDTGGPGLIVRRFLVNNLGLKVTVTGETGIGAGGKVPILKTTVNSLKIGDLEFKNVEALVLELKGLDEKIGHRLYGCIGYDILKDFKVCIDYPNRKFILIK